MKKGQKIRRIFLLTLLFMMAMTTTCFADVYFSPTEELVYTIPFFEIIIVILAVVLVISLSCILVGKINKSEELVNKAKKWSECIFYYLLVMIGIAYAVYTLAFLFVVAIIPFIFIVVSILLRAHVKNKKYSYGVLSVYLIWVAASLISML